MLGMIPAAGSAERWGGHFLKELLPIGYGMTLLDHTIQEMAKCGCDEFVVATQPWKINIISDYLYRHYHTQYRISYTVGGTTLWESVRSMLPYAQETNLVMLPDTVAVMGERNWGWTPSRFPFHLAYFRTQTPERFSIFHDGHILTKPKNLAPSSLYEAWGAFAFTKPVAQAWQALDEPLYDVALDYAQHEFATSFSLIAAYHDIADWNQYLQYLRMEGQLHYVS